MAAREPDTRYASLLGVFRAVRKVDPFSPGAPTFMDRRFNLERQIPETETEALLISVLASPEVRGLGARHRERLGRPLEPFDIWYSGFKPGVATARRISTAIVRAKYPTAQAFRAGPAAASSSISASRRRRPSWLAGRIAVDPSRGAGHAMGAVRREDKAHLRTRVPRGGMDYKGYNIALHELGHNVEQVFSLNGIDRWSLSGVPNTAFTEALAFVFQSRDLELLGLADAERGDRSRPRRSTTSGTPTRSAAWRWWTCGCGGGCTPTPRPPRPSCARRCSPRPGGLEPLVRAGLRRAGLEHPGHLLPHDRPTALYLPDYPIGHIIAFQVGAQAGGGDFGAELERMARQGRVTPDGWMRGAVGGPISAQALLDAAGEALATQTAMP